MLRKLFVSTLGVVTLGLVGVGFGSQTASAEVISEGRVPFTYVVDNPCEAGNNPITFAGTVHWLWYTVPGDLVMMRYNVHYTATAADGTGYVLNVNRTMEHSDWPASEVGSDSLVFKLISKGDGANARIQVTVESSTVWPAPPELTVIDVICRG